MAKKKENGMLVQIARDELSLALRRVKGVVEKDAAAPGLACALLRTEKDRISVSAYDLEVGITSTHEATIAVKGTIAVPAKLLRGIVEVAPENVIELQELDGNRVQVCSGQMESEIAGMTSDEVQTVSAPESIRFSPCDTAALLSLIDGVLLAVSHDQTRYNLCGALLERTKLGWRMVATDGHRMSILERHIEEGNARSVEGQVFLPEKTLVVMRSILAEDDAATGQMGFNKSVVCFRRSGLEIVSRLGECEFPDWRAVVPETMGHTLEITRRQFIHAVERMGPIVGRGPVVIHAGKNVLKVRAEHPDRGSIHDRMTVEHGGADVTFGLNAGYLLDALNSLDSEAVQLGCEDSLSPVVLRPVGNEKLSSWIVMPMRVEIAEIERIQSEDLDQVFEPLRAEFREQNRKKLVLETIRKLGRDAARAARRENGGPLAREKSPAWPPAGFWQKAEIDLGREIPDDERAICRDTYWAEATKPMLVKDEVEEPEVPTAELKTRLKELELIGMQAGAKAKAANGNKLAAFREWPAPGFWLLLEQQLGRSLIEAERAACVQAYHQVATAEKEQPE